MNTKPASAKHVRLGLLFAVVTFIADQFSKIWLVEHMNLADIRGGIDVLPIFKLVMVWNHGISFGMFADADDTSRRWVLIVVAVIITAAMVAWLWKCRHNTLSLGLGLIIGGAIGNVVDRVRWGAVADFFYFHYEEWYWPAFNIADSAIFIGVVLLCWDSIVNPEKTT